MFDDELTGYEEHLRDSEFTGDPRRCPRHPGVRTSSDDGMFDAPCHLCEGEMSDEADRWDCNPENPRRSQCGYPTNSFFQWPTFWSASRVPDECPF